MPEQSYHEIKADISQIAKACGRNPDAIKLVPVSKGHPIEAIQTVYDAGARCFGESRIQEAFEKMNALPFDIEWHLIGSLQRKKVPKVIGKFALIHSVDSIELAEALSKASQSQQLVTRILLQVNTSGETSKHGLSVKDWKANMEIVLGLPGIHVEGLMTMAPLTEDTNFIRHCFSQLRLLNEEYHLPHLSMGMSHDYRIAIEEGATLLRIGTQIFDGVS